MNTPRHLTKTTIPINIIADGVMRTALPAFKCLQFFLQFSNTLLLAALYIKIGVCRE